MPSRSEFDALKVALSQAIADLSDRVAALNTGTPLTDQDVTDLQTLTTRVQTLLAPAP